MSTKTSSMSTGTSYIPWFEVVKKVLSAEDIPIPEDHSLFHKLYHDDYTAQEVYWHLRIMSINTALVQMRWTDKHGTESTTFSTNEEIRHFLKQNPRFHERLKGKRNKTY